MEKDDFDKETSSTIWLFWLDSAAKHTIARGKLAALTPETAEREEI
jgi:hypothetical protein